MRSSRTLLCLFPTLALVFGLLSICFFEVQVTWKWRENIMNRWKRLGPRYTGTLLIVYEVVVLLGVLFASFVLSASYCLPPGPKRRRCHIAFYSTGAVLLALGNILIAWYHSIHQTKGTETFLLISYAFGAGEALILLLGAFGTCLTRPRRRDDFYVSVSDPDADAEEVVDERTIRTASRATSRMTSGMHGAGSEMTSFSKRW